MAMDKLCGWCRKTYELCTCIAENFQAEQANPSGSLAGSTADTLSVEEPDLTKPPCQECGAMTPEEAETMCICSGDKDHCHGCDLWPD